MLHVARKAFAPARLPFSLLHIDTGHNLTAWACVLPQAGAADGAAHTNDKTRR